MTIPYLLNHPIIAVVLVLVAILGAGRVTRVLVYDDYPPSRALRTFWINTIARGGGWAKLAECAWCAAPWVMAVLIGWFFLTPLAPWILWSFWIFWSWMALSYVTVMVYVRDEPKE